MFAFTHLGCPCWFIFNFQIISLKCSVWLWELFFFSSNCHVTAHIPRKTYFTVSLQYPRPSATFYAFLIVFLSDFVSNSRWYVHTNQNSIVLSNIITLITVYSLIAQYLVFIHLIINSINKLAYVTVFLI